MCPPFAARPHTEITTQDTTIKTTSTEDAFEIRSAPNIDNTTIPAVKITTLIIYGR